MGLPISLYKREFDGLVIDTVWFNIKKKKKLFEYYETFHLFIVHSFSVCHVLSLPLIGQLAMFDDVVFLIDMLTYQTLFYMVGSVVYSGI